MTQLRVGLIGAGGIAAVHIAGWQQLGAHITVFSRSGAAHLVRAHGIVEARSVAELLAVSDVISILTPTSTHYDYVMAAIAAGKDVLCEKPLAESTERAVAMVKAARSAGVRLVPAHVVRFFPEYADARHLLETGAIDRPQVLRLSRSSAAPAAGSWFFDQSQGGGIVPDQMIHDIDQAYWLAGDVIRVNARQSPRSEQGILPRPVTASIELTHSSGAVSYLSGEWGPDGLPFSTRISLEAADGSALYAWPVAHHGSSASPPAAANTPGDYLPAQRAQDSPYTLQIAEFARAHVAATTSGLSAPARAENLKGSGTPATPVDLGAAAPRVSADDGVMAVALAAAATASIALGRAVDFSASAVRSSLAAEEG